MRAEQQGAHFAGSEGHLWGFSLPADCLLELPVRLLSPCLAARPLDWLANYGGQSVGCRSSDLTAKCLAGLVDSLLRLQKQEAASPD
mmetsp:Transcript_18420/g.34168  ORF Transcript_18420/g.34168 Transcript_18420/m.34168 type:complete len:87 (-) Transcript_18420:202-462(-)